MRKIIAAIQTTLDGYIEGPNGELDWAMADDDATWEEAFRMLDSVDACVLGRKMYPDYERYWLAVLANPAGPLPLSGQAATEGEIAYARWADGVPHYVLSRTLDSVKWRTTRIARDIGAIRELKAQAGKSIYVVGGATLISGLLNAGLIDELRLSINPLILGGGTPLFKDVSERQALRLVDTRALPSGKVSLTYSLS
jgi:dihydrofolate reductase